MGISIAPPQSSFGGGGGTSCTQKLKEAKFCVPAAQILMK
jgi:hypothetical protein